ncbi:MAG: hypothetical protein U9Q38_01420, partial [Thermodesulfobacteriota bacterium]|nr:hypothetical protein [Thermodesulfobacteriota bacterium]
QKPSCLGFCTNKRNFILPEEALGVAVKADQVKPGSLLNHNRLLVADLNPHPLKMQAIEAGTKQITNVDASTWEADIDTIHKSNLERDCAWLLPQLEKRGYRIGKWQTDLAPVALLSPAQLTSIHNPLGIVLMIPAIGLVDLYFALVKSEPEYQYAWFSFFGDIRNIDPSYTKQQLLNSNPAAWAFILGEET